MGKAQFSSLIEVFEHYGRSNLIAIDNLRQIIFYTANGYQPEYVCENGVKPNRITCWFLKEKTKDIYKKWQNNKPQSITHD